MEIALLASTFFGFKSTINKLSCRNNDIATALERNLHAGTRKKSFAPPQSKSTQQVQQQNQKKKQQP